MSRILDYLKNVEPAVAFMAIRTLVYLGVGATGSWLNPDNAEQILSVLGLILGVDAATTAGTRARVTSPRSAADLVSSVFVGQVGDFIRKVVRDSVPDNKFTDGLRTVVPVMAEYANSRLDDETRSRVHRQVHLRLRSAGLLRKRDVNVNASIVLILPLLVLLVSACAPFQDFTGGVIDRAVGDDAQLTQVATGVQFDPGAEAALHVSVEIVGTTLVTEDRRCELEPLPDLDLLILGCELGTVAEPDTIVFSGTDVTASAEYRRDGRSRPFFTTLD